MKAIFYILALLVTGGAAYFSFDNLNKFKDQQEQKVTTAGLADSKKKQADAKQGDLDKERLVLDDANKDKADAETSIEALVLKEGSLKKELKELESTLEEQKGKFADLAKIQEEVNNTLKDVPGGVSLEELPEKVEQMEADKTAKTKTLAELETNVEAAKKTVESNQSEIGRLADRSASRDSRIRRNAMQSVVSAVNEDWGFVIIGAGSNTGFTPQTKLLVKRNGRLIAEVKPSSVEPSQTIAEIDPDTIAPGARIQPGDSVILAEPATN